jgi:serine/threonine protein kinase
MSREVRQAGSARVVWRPMKGVETSGDRIGRYRLLERLGEGGMGVVHLAEDARGRKVAIKVLRPAVAGDVTALRRLAREVDTMRRVHSPHVAEIIDADVTAEPPYVVTQFVPGSTLEESVLEDGPLYGRALQRLACGLAEALAAIHAAGVIHRDLKPGNVMFLDGEPIVIDFGIAQAVDATRLTATGLVIGTPGYLAPEIIEGEDAGAPADVHSWASTIAFAATGRPPFGSGTFESVFYKIMEGKSDLDGVPDALLPLIRSAMARHPAERPPAATLAQFAGRIDLDVTSPDFMHQASSPVDAHNTRRDRRVAATPPPPGGPPPAQPRDFKGLLPPANPPPPSARPAPVTAPQAQVPGRQAPHPYAPGPYGPVAQQRPGAHPPSRAERRKPEGWYRVLSFLLLAGTLGLAAMLPFVTLIVVVVVLVVLRMGDRAAQNMEFKTRGRAARPGEVVWAALKSPFALPRAALKTLFVSPIGALAAAVVLFALVVSGPAISIPRTIAVSVGVFILVQCVGPGSEAIRRQARRIWGVVVPRSEHAIVLAVCLGLLAVFLVTLAPTQVPDLRPFEFDWMTDGLDQLRDVVRDVFGTG